jgi:3-hydroxy-9,10-secoandrosta-1,3,5(10)-triene-9,17-dione monooxygenase reductase component
MTVSSDDFKRALGCWATGVTIVTARAGDRVHGMTVSAFTEVSLEPPLVLFCAEKSSNTLPLILEGGVFAVNVLARDQSALSNKFASKKDEWKRFEGLDYDSGPTGAPLLRGATATLDCEVATTHEHGDHVVIVGSVREVRSSERAPLLYFCGRYGGFGE